MNYVRLLAHDAIHGLRGFLVLDAFVRLFIWAASLAFCVALFTHYGLWPTETIVGANLPRAWSWAETLVKWIVVYNSIYVLMLIVLRLPIPTPREGRYSLVPGKIPSIQLVWSCLIATLTKARFEAPFPAFLVFHMANLPPLSWLMSVVFGPRSKSCYVTDPRIIDPHLVSVGRNVVIGINAIIAAHYQEKDAVIIKRTIIEDDVIIGASVLMSGAHIKRGATIGAGRGGTAGYSGWRERILVRQSRTSSEGFAGTERDCRATGRIVVRHAGLFPPTGGAEYGNHLRGASGADGIVTGARRFERTAPSS